MVARGQLSPEEAMETLQNKAIELSSMEDELLLAATVSQTDVAEDSQR